MERIDLNPIPKDSAKEVRLFAMTRNESLRLPYFIEYYTNLGVDRLIFVDNGSTDSSRDIILSNPQCHLYSTRESFTNYPYWNENLFRLHGNGHWCVAVDIDEFLVYSECETNSIRSLCDRLERQGVNALHCILLDMYSQKSFANIDYEPGQNPIEVCPYFDPDFEIETRTLFNPKACRYFSTPRITGNMRQRVFSLNENLSKAPLFKFDNKLYLYDGRHYIDGAKVADARGALLHMKYLQDFNSRAVEEKARGVHSGGGASYKVYADAVTDNIAITGYWAGSQRYSSSKTLEEKGVIYSNETSIYK